MTLDRLDFNQSYEPEAQQAETLYQQSLLYFQNGQWQKAINGFQEVLRLQPNYVQAQAFLEEARVKASLEHEQPTPKRFRFQGAMRYVLFILIAAALVLLLAVGARWAYARWVAPARAAQEAVQRRSQLLEQAYKYLADRDYTAAQETFRSLLAEDPNNEQAQKGLAEAQAKAALAEQYAKAKEAIVNQRWDEAADLLAAIAAADPKYQDVQTQQALVQKQLELKAWFDKAEAAYAAGNWQEALSAYETLQNLDAEYEKQAVNQRLFESYLKQGRFLVEDTKGDSQAVEQARGLFQRALVLQPQHPQAVQELALADKFLQGKKELAQGNREAARTALEWVCQQQPDYAGGTAKTLLQVAGGEQEIVQPVPTSVVTTTVPSGATFHQQFASALQRGDAAMNASDYALAEQHYREATRVAIHGGYDSARWLYVAYVKLGTSYARSGKYEEALEAIKTAISIMTKSAVAIPEETYSHYLEEAERYAKKKDYHNALLQYDQAVHIIGQKCNCGLEDWRVVP